SESGVSPVTAAAAKGPIEVPDGPCWVFLSSAGLIARMDTGEIPPDSGPRAVHDVLISAIRTRTRADIGVLTSQGRILRLGAIELASIPPTSTAVTLQGGVPLKELVVLDSGEMAVGLSTLGDQTRGWAMGTRRGVVKRTNPEILSKDSWEIIRLDEGDEVVSAVELLDEASDLVFISSDSSLLRFPASKVRPQGRSGGGMAGITLAPGAQVVFFGAVSPDSGEVVTIAGSSRALPGTEAGTVKVSGFDLFPVKGRATGGVRSHRFLKGEDRLLGAWVGPAPAVAATDAGTPVQLPTPDSRRDGSGVPAGQPIAAVGTRTVSGDTTA
ncbi:MAG: DNA topoisomerase IV, partial [Propionibacteriaceae bacterium]|nr:DNA topoisomerase IV [Propionibacteriaceae bacterium]